MQNTVPSYFSYTFTLIWIEEARSQRLVEMRVISKLAISLVRVLGWGSTTLWALQPSGRNASSLVFFLTHTLRFPRGFLLVPREDDQSIRMCFSGYRSFCSSHRRSRNPSLERRAKKNLGTPLIGSSHRKSSPSRLRRRWRSPAASGRVVTAPEKIETRLEASNLVRQKKKKRIYNKYEKSDDPPSTVGKKNSFPSSYQEALWNSRLYSDETIIWRKKNWDFTKIFLND